MGKKIVIVILIIAALGFAIIQPWGSSTLGDELLNELGGGVFSKILVFIIMFYIGATVPMFWIGIPAGWRFAQDHDWGIIGTFISLYIGMLVSLPVAIYQLFAE